MDEREPHEENYHLGKQMVMRKQAQADLVKAINNIAAAMPLARTVQIYEFALFLKSHSLPTEETFEEISADEALWDAQFAVTDDDKLAALVASVEAEINEDRTVPMFGERGEFVERKWSREQLNPSESVIGLCLLGYLRVGIYCKG